MEAIQALRQGLPWDVLTSLANAWFMSRYLAPSTEKQSNPTLTSWAPFGAKSTMLIGFFALSLASRSWLALVGKYVPEPYLDEVFHIPQAQTYCEGRFWDWDDKITTPPGLYILSVAYHKLRTLSECTPSSLRPINLLATLLIALLAAQCRHLVEVRAAEREGKKGSGSVSFNAYYTGLNIAFFPVMFFFSALYYTDVVSTLVVLFAYRNHLRRLGPQTLGFLNDLWTVALGVAALFMRQTNVFWVVVYMGGLEVVHVLRSVKPGTQDYLELHDPPLNQSGPEDWLFCGLTIAVTALSNPVRILRQIWPHITILVLFAGFVAWNGGVVLGDKSNHIATIHLAQMLYIWPLFAFFSAPLLIPSALSAITRPSQYLQSLLSLTSTRAALVSAPYTLLSILLSLAIVRYNTIIHPFTLADNRHYMFYIFRHTILRSPTTRLSLVATYTACRWLVWDQLAGTSHATTLTTLTTPAATNPTIPPEPNPKTDTPDEDENPKIMDKPLPFLGASPTSRQASSAPPLTSTALLWLLTTALSLVTAPLVEPRYFILPWVFYRLLVPASSVSDTAFLAGSEAKRGRGWLWTVGRKVDVRLVLETVWFVGINVGTMYMFLWRGFYWRGEDGGVADGGRVQRFMW